MKRGLYIVWCLIASLAINNAYAQLPDITYVTPQSYTVGVPITPLSPTNNGGPIPATIFGQATTFAGSVTAGRADGLGQAAGFKNPRGVAMDGAGNIYVTDAGNNLIRKITPAGLVTTFAGSGADGSADGQGILATFSEPTGLAIDAAGFLYVTDRKSHIIRKISPAGLVTTIAGKPGFAGAVNSQGTSARFNNPTGIAIDASGYLYVADYSNNMVRGIAPDGNVRTIAGNGSAGNGVTSDADKKGAAATFRSPGSIAVTPDGKSIYVGEQTYIRKIDENDNVVTIAGGFFSGNYDGTFKGASVNQPAGLALDAAGTIFIGDAGNNLIRRFDVPGQVTTVAGFSRGYADGVGPVARFNGGAGTAVNAQGDVYMADPGNNTIRKIITTGYTISPNLPAGLTFDSSTGTISGTPTEKIQATSYSIFAYNTTGKNAVTISIEVRVPGLIKQTITFPPLPAKKERDVDFNADATSTNNTIPITYTSSDTQVATITDGKIHILGPGTVTITAFQAGSIDYEEAVPVSQDLVIAANPAPIKYPTVTIKAPVILPLNTGGTYKAKLDDVAAVTGDPAETAPVVVLGNSNFNCSSVGPQTITVTAGYGPDPANPLNAEFNAPSNIAIDAQGNIFISDPGNYMVRELSNTGRVTTFAGSGQVGSADGKNTVAQFSRGLLSMVTDMNGNIYVCDILNMLVRKITPKGDVTSFATSALKAANGGNAVDARSIAIDRSGNIYIADKSRIYQVSADGNTVSVFAGNTVQANVDGTGTAAGFSGIVGLAFDVNGNMYVSTNDLNYVNSVKKITPDGVVKTLTTVTSSSVHFTRLVVDTKENIFIASSDNKIYKVANGIFSTFVGSVAGDEDGSGTEALFNNPQGIAIDASDNLYIADSDNHKIKKITPGAIVSTIAGNGHPGHVDNTSVSNAQTTNVPVTITSPLLFTDTFADVTIPVSSSCVAVMPDYTATAKAISYCSPNVTITQSPAAGTPMPIGIPVTVTLTANDDLSINDKATVSFKVTAKSSSPPTIRITPDNISSCTGLTVTFNAVAANAGANPTYQWQVNGITVFSGGAEYTTATLATGDKITCIVTNNDGCAPVSATSNQVVITVNAAVNPVVTIVPSTTDAICPGSLVRFTATTTNLQADQNPIYQWQINDAIAGANNPIFETTALQNGDLVTCKVISGGTCVINPEALSNTIIAQIKTESECTITINNTFTPNGDGVNDFWNLPVLQSYPTCSVLIYTRYGKLIYQSIGYSKPWDGVYNGSNLASGTYYYVIDTKTGKKPLSGSVTILR